MITIKEIAQKAGVSTGTVDRVLHDRAGVSLKTKEKVLKLLKEHNFKVNVIASTLAMRKKYTIGVLIPNYDEHNLFWKTPNLGIQNAAEDVENFGVQVHSFLYDQFDRVTFNSEFKNMIAQKPDAVIIVPIFTKETEEQVKVLEEKNIPYVFLNVDLKGFNNISFVGSDSYKSGYLAGKLMHLALPEKAKIATIQTSLRDHNFHVTTKRIEGFNAYFDSKKLTFENLTISFNDLNTPKEISKTIASFLEENPTTKGIFVPSSRIGVIANEIHPNKIKELKLIGFDTTESNIEHLKNDRITFLISQKSFYQGFDAVQLLTKYLLHKTKPNSKVLSPLEIFTKENFEFSQQANIVKN